MREEFRKRFGNPYAVIHRADIHLSIYEECRRRRTSRCTRPRAVMDIAGRRQVRARHRPERARVRRRGADRSGRRAFGRAQEDHRRWRRPRARPRRLSRRDAARGDSRGPALERGDHLGRPEMPSRALSAARRRAVQHRGDVPQPREGGMGRARGLAGRGHVLFHPHRRKAAPASRQADVVEALGPSPTAIP